MDTISTTVTLRPVRAGFLVDPNDRQTLSHVMRMATCLWGGALCPMIPVMKTLPRPWRGEPFRKPTPLKVTRGYLNFFEPDLFVSTAPGQFERAGLHPKARFGLRDRYRSVDKLIQRAINARPALDFGAEMFEVYDHLYRKVFQFQRRHPRPNLYITPGDRAGEAFCETAYGMFPQDVGLDHIERAYRQAIEPTEAAPDVSAWGEAAKGAGTPFDYTLHGIDLRYEGMHDVPVFIFDPLKGPDVIDAWNFRLFAKDPLFVNVHWLEASRELLLQTITANYRPLPTNRHGMMIGTTLHISRSLNMQEVMRQLDLPPKELPPHSLSVQPWYHPIWQSYEDEHVFRPVAVAASVKEKQAQLLPTGDTLPVPVVAPDFEVRWRGLGPTWVNVVRASTYGADTEYAQALPSAAMDDLGDYPVRSVHVQTPTREGYVTFPTYAAQRGHFSLPTRVQAVTSWLAANGLKAEPSESGRVADQVIASLGGLWGTRLIADEEVLRLLDKMARRGIIRSGGDTEEYSDSTASVKTWIDTQKRLEQRHRYGGPGLIERLVKAGALRLGVATKCPHCAKENWHSVDDMAVTIGCDRCRKTYPFPEASPQLAAWKYRVVGPFATPHFAQGSYSVALTLAYLERLKSMSRFTYSTSLELTTRSGTKLETDLFAWISGSAVGPSRSDPATVVGECKSLGTDTVKAADIKRLRALGQALPGAYLIVATLKDHFTAGEVRRLRSLCRWGWSRRGSGRAPSRLIMLTGIDLLDDGPPLSGWKQASGILAAVAASADHVFDLEALAVATQRGHLGLSDKEVHAIRYPPVKGIPPTASGVGITLA